jgi:signal transduction histidine kinase
MKGNEKPQNHRQAGHRHSWWHGPLVGYPLAVLFATSAFLIPLSERSLGIQDFFVEPPFVIAMLPVGWFWGVGPALLALLLEVLALDYWIVPPLGVIDFFLWPDIASFVPFILIQLIVLRMVIVQKKDRQQLLQTNQAVSQHAEEVAENNARLQQADQIKDQFLSMATHELRTPVTSIQGYVQLLLRRLKRQSTQNPDLLPVYDSLGKVDEQIRQLTELVKELLDINTLRSGKMPVHLALCDLCGLCRQVVEEQQALAGRSIDLRLPADPVIVHVDNGRFSQVVSNALKYSPVNTLIRVEVSQRPGEVILAIREALLAVSNEGPVLSKAQQESLFEPFYRSPDVQSSATPGWGLGLAICKEIVVQHSGCIWVESSAEKGTTFFVALPLPTNSESA